MEKLKFKIIRVQESYSSIHVNRTRWFWINHAKGQKATLISIDDALLKGFQHDREDTSVWISGLYDHDLTDDRCIEIFVQAGKGVILCEAMLSGGTQQGIEFIRSQFKRLIGL